MNEFDIDKKYVSAIDIFITEFDKEHPLSASQLKEIKKYQRIFALRDGVKYHVEISEIWEEF